MLSSSSFATAAGVGGVGTGVLLIGVGGLQNYKIAKLPESKTINLTIWRRDFAV